MNRNVISKNTIDHQAKKGETIQKYVYVLSHSDTFRQASQFSLLDSRIKLLLVQKL